MNAEWFIQRGSERLGPYTWEQMQEFAANGRVQPSDMVWHAGMAQWASAVTVAGLFPAPAPSPTPPPPASVAAPKTKSSCCLGGCLGCLGKLLVVLIVLVGVVALALYIRGQRPSKNIVFGKPVPGIEQAIGKEGGRVVVDQPGNPLNGFAIEVPEGAYDGKTKFNVSYQPIQEHKLGPNFNPVTPLISVHNGGGYSDEPMTVTIPVPDDPERFTMAFYYDRKTGRLEGLPLMGASPGQITVATRHFSDVVATSIKIDELEGKLDIDTGFRPGVDDWQFTNYGSWASPGGHCSGQSISAMWYFYEKRKQGERPLYGRYDNNNRGYGTIDFWEDDSWGYRLASAVQEDHDWGSLLFKLASKSRGYDDRLTMLAFAYAMTLTGGPQHVGLTSSTSPGGHAIIAYRMGKDKLYVADPNYPGAERIIQYRNGKLGPYNSGANATAIAQGNQHAYDQIGYCAETALIDWGQVGHRWAQVEDGKAGDDYFGGGYELQVLQGEKLNDEWVALADGYETDEAETAKPDTNLLGKIAVALDTGTPGRRLTVYRGTDALVRDTATAGKFATVEIELEKGANDLGILVEQPRGQEYCYVDFKRLTVNYGPAELAGRWKGTLVVDEAERLMRFLEEIAVKLAREFTDETDEQKIRQGFRDSAKVESEPQEFILTIEAVPNDKEHYDVFYYHEDDEGKVTEFKDRARYENGELRFSLEYPEIAEFNFEGRLKDNKTLYGTFNANLWVVIRNAISGHWEVERTD